MDRSRLRMMTFLFTFSLAATGCGGCGDFNYTRPSVNRASYQAQSYANAPAKLLAVDQMFTIKASKKITGTAYGFMQAPRELWAPFRWEVTAGSLDPDGTNVGPGFFCTELDGKGTDPLEYFGICAQPVSGGLNVFVIRRGNSNVGQTFLGSTSRVDFAVEADGANLTFQARNSGGGGWTTVATVPFSDPGYALLPSVGANQLPADTQADFDFFRVLSNGTKPGATGDDLAAEAAWKVVDALLEAGYALDGFAQNTAQADEAFSDAEAAVTAAQALATGISDPKAAKTFSSKLASVAKGVGKVRAKIGKGKPAKTVIKPLKGLLKNATLAAPALQ